MLPEPADILVIAAHPDDAEFGAAGTVAKLIREGKKVVYVLCTSGEKGTSDRTMKPERLAKIREQEQLAAADVLGVREVVFLRYPDQGLEDTAESRKALVREIRKFRPQIVISADPYRRYRWHRDHRIVGQVVLDAVFPYARDYHAYPDLIEEGLEPHVTKEVWLWGTEDRNLQFDITDTFKFKMAALRCHKSQVGDWSKIEARMKEWAKDMAKGTKYELAEAFHRVDMTW